MTKLKCENPKHKGDPYKNHGTGRWWLKDPEWQDWCPNCHSNWFVALIKKYEEEFKNEN